MWRINREAVLLGAGPAALLLQIAHPLVAEGVAAHSGFPADAFLRLRRTLRTTLDIVFGDGATAERAVRRLNAVHASVRGEVIDPIARAAAGASRYRALDPELLLWVQATLIVMSVRAHEAWVGAVSAADKDALWNEARGVGELLGIPAAVSPATWSGLVDWFEEQLAPGGAITVTPTARSLAPSIIRPPVPYLPPAAIDLAALPGLALLPPHIREAFAIPWSAQRDRLATWLTRGVRAWTAILPCDWRAMPRARAAERRCRRARGHRGRKPGRAARDLDARS
jgi:uncharacterized protein (DUF2236 family)